jgi:hypothetical protein
MSELQIEGNICEIGGAFYPVKLHAVPRIGELIDFFSFIDQANGHPPAKHYEVVQVVHAVRDVSEKISQSKDGCHFVSVFVKPTQSQFFN